MNEQIVKHLKAQIRTLEADLITWKVALGLRAHEAAEAEQMVEMLTAQLQLASDQLGKASGGTF